MTMLCKCCSLTSLRTAPYSLSELYPLIPLSRINSDIISTKLVSKHPIEHEAIETVHLIIYIPCQTLCHPLSTLTIPKPGTVIATSLACNTATLDLTSYPRHHYLQEVISFLKVWWPLLLFAHHLIQLATFIGIS